MFLEKNQFPVDEIDANSDINATRIHVERFTGCVVSGVY